MGVKEHQENLFLMIICLMLVFVPAGLSQTPTPVCLNTGDVMLDGAVTAGDAQLSFEITLGVYSPSYGEFCAADCNDDGTVTAGDAQQIFAMVLGLDECADPLGTPTPELTSTPSTPTATPTEEPPYSVDPIVGNMRYVPAGTFTQGSPGTEPCRDADETQFEHTLTRNLAVMETEVTRQMWWVLQALAPDLPDDPTNESYGAGATNPVQVNTWYESVLFANLLSLANGFTRCYYSDAEFTIPIDVTNYLVGPFYCDFDANGYRLATEGEWEYFTRAETTGPFSCDEPNYTDATCGSPSCVSGELSVLEQYAVFCANDNGESEPVGSKLGNPWNLKDVHGNVWEWCWDWYSASYPVGMVTDYAGAGTGSFRVLRGGCWYDYERNCRSAGRDFIYPQYRSSFLGFRLLRSTN